MSGDTAGSGTSSSLLGGREKNIRNQTLFLNALSDQDSHEIEKN